MFSICFDPPWCLLITCGISWFSPPRKESLFCQAHMAWRITEHLTNMLGWNTVSERYWVHFNVNREFQVYNLMLSLMFWFHFCMAIGKLVRKQPVNCVTYSRWNKEWFPLQQFGGHMDTWSAKATCYLTYWKTTRQSIYQNWMQKCVLAVQPETVWYETPLIASLWVINMSWCVYFLSDCDDIF